MTAPDLIPVLLHRSQIDDHQWDALLSVSAQDVIYAHCFYLDIVAENWQALVCYRQGAYHIIMPLPLKRKWGMNVISQPLFCQYLGVFSKESLTAEIISVFLKAVSLHFPYISSYCFNPENYAVLNSARLAFKEISFAVQHTHWLGLNAGYQQIFSQYSRDRICNLRRSQKHGWEITEDGPIQPMIDLFKAHQASHIPGGVHANAYTILETIFEKGRQRGIAQLWYGQKEQEKCAGLLILKSRGRAIYLFNAANQQGRKANARTFMLDAYFGQHAGQPLVFDFESPEKAAIAGFYRSFAARPIPYFKITKNGLIFPLRQIQRWRLWYFS